jgi:23S rRNA pseudouridine2605 synthase
MKTRNSKDKIPPDESKALKLNKFIAHCGICSRRQAAELIKKGEVMVNGKVEVNPAYEVKPKDKISHKGIVVQPQSKMIYILLNKPKDTITTLNDERNRNTVFDLIKHKIEERIYPVGRLDRNTTGLLLMTNDGDLAQRLAHPSHKMKKIYHVYLDRNLTPRDFEKIQQGFELEDGFIKVDGIDYVEAKKNEIGIQIHSGKNRIVRRIFEHLEYQIEKLDRVYLAGLTKKNLPRGKFRHLTTQEVIMLKHFNH